MRAQKTLNVRTHVVSTNTKWVLYGARARSLHEIIRHTGGMQWTSSIFLSCENFASRYLVMTNHYESRALPGETTTTMTIIRSTALSTHEKIVFQMLRIPYKYDAGAHVYYNTAVLVQERSVWRPTPSGPQRVDLAATKKKKKNNRRRKPTSAQKRV